MYDVPTSEVMCTIQGAHIFVTVSGRKACSMSLCCIWQHHKDFTQFSLNIQWNNNDH